jgi:hypothetical protein
MDVIWMKLLHLNKKQTYVIIFIAFLFMAIVPVWKTGGSGIIQKTDTEFPNNPAGEFSRYLYVWSPDYDLGYNQSVIETYKLPILGLEALAQKLSVPLWLINRSIFILPLLLMAIGMFFLASLSTKKLLPRFIASAFFIYNPLVILTLLNGQWLVLLGLAMIPFLMYFLISGLNDNNNSAKYMFGIGLVSLFIRPANIMYLALLFSTAYLLFHMITVRPRVWPYAAKFVGASFALALCLNMWFLLPAFKALISGNVPYDAGQLAYMNQTSSYSSLLYNALLGQTPNSPPFAYEFYSNLFHSRLFIIASILLLAITFSAFWWHRRKLMLFFSVAFIVCLFLGKGSSEPFGRLYIWLFIHFPGIATIRSPFHFVELLTIPYALLLASSLSEIDRLLTDVAADRFFKTYGNKIFYFTILGLIIITSFPIYSGDLNGWLKPIQLPAYYEESAEWLNNQTGTFNILIPRSSWMIKYEWSAYDMPAIYRQLSNKPVIDEWDLSRSNNIPQDYILSLTKTVTEPDGWKNQGKYLAVANVKYILISRDVELNPFTGTDPRIDPTLLPQLGGFHLERTFGKIDFYRNDYWEQQQIFASSNFMDFNGTFDDLDRIFASSDFSGKNDISFFRSDLTPTQLQFLRQNSSLNPFMSTTGIPIYNGLQKGFNWLSPGNNNFEGRFYPGWKSVITNGSNKEDTLSSLSPDKLSSQSPSLNSIWNAFNSTLIYAKTDSQGLNIYRLLENGQQVNDLIGVWWETGSTGVNNKEVTYPIIIPPNQKCIIQINHEATNISLVSSPLYMESISGQNDVRDNSSIQFEYLNPAKYEIGVTNATQPFFLVFSNNYDAQWKAYVNPEGRDTNWVQAFFQKAISDGAHFKANGYANAWYIDPGKIDPGEDFNITLYYKPQSYFYLGGIISGAALIGCLAASIIIMKKRRKHSKSKISLDAI